MKENSAVELHQTQSGVLKKRDSRMCFFAHAGHALQTRAGHIPPSFFSRKRADK